MAAVDGLTEGMKITVAGAGAMGCRFGAALFEAGHHVTLLDGWREHVTAINEAGLRVTDATGTRTLAVPAVLFPEPAHPPAPLPTLPPCSRAPPSAARRRPGRPGYRVRQGDGDRSRGRRRDRDRRDRAVHPGPHAAERPRQHRGAARPRAREPAARGHDDARHRTARPGAHPGARVGRDRARPAAGRARPTPAASRPSPPSGSRSRSTAPGSRSAPHPARWR